MSECLKEGIELDVSFSEVMNAMVSRKRLPPKKVKKINDRYKKAWENLRGKLFKA
jgi:hypothetical protein